MWENHLHTSPWSTQLTLNPSLNGVFTAVFALCIAVFHALKLQFQNWMDFVTLFLLCVPRFKNDLPLNDYRIKQKSDALVIREVKETDAGIYTVILTNKITKEEQRRSFQLLVNGVFFSVFFPFCIHFQLPVVDMTLLLPLQFLLVS